MLKPGENSNRLLDLIGGDDPISLLLSQSHLMCCPQSENLPDPSLCFSFFSYQLRCLDHKLPFPPSLSLQILTHPALSFLSQPLRVWIKLFYTKTSSKPRVKVTSFGFFSLFYNPTLPCTHGLCTLPLGISNFFDPWTKGHLCATEFCEKCPVYMCLIINISFLTSLLTR